MKKFFRVLSLATLLLFTLSCIILSGCATFSSDEAKAPPGGTLVKFGPVLLPGDLVGYKGSVSVNKDLIDFTLDMGIDDEGKVKTLSVSVGESKGLQAQIIRLEETAKTIRHIINRAAETVPGAITGGAMGVPLP